MEIRFWPRSGLTKLEIAMVQKIINRFGTFLEECGVMCGNLMKHTVFEQEDGTGDAGIRYFAHFRSRSRSRRDVSM